MDCSILHSSDEERSNMLSSTSSDEQDSAHLENEEIGLENVAKNQSL